MYNEDATLPQGLCPDAQSIHDFLTRIAKGIHIFGTSQDDGLPFGRYFGNNVEADLKFAFDMNAGQNDVYFTPNEPHPDCGHKPNKLQIARIRAAYVDIDTYKPGAPFDKDAAHKRVMEDHPSLVIDSGNGLHVYWILAEAVEATPENVDMLETVNRALVARYCGDPAVIPVCQVLRVPGTVNWPNAKKRELGRVPCMAKVLYEGGSAIGNPTLALLFAHFVTNAAPPTSTNSRNAIATRSDAEVSERLLNAKNDTKAVPLYNGDRSGYASPSEADMALLCIIAHYTEDRSQVARVYKASAMFRSSKYDGRDKLLETEIEKAFAQNATFKVPTRGNEGFEGASPKGVLDFWPDPIPLPGGLPAVASFKPEFLPAALAPWVMDIGERMQCPPDFAASTAITAAGAVIGTRLVIRPKPKNNWNVAPNLWAMNVGRPGMMKSPAINEALGPIRRYENEARKKNTEAFTAFAREMHQHKLKVSAIEAAFKKAGDPNAAIDIPPMPVEPLATRRIVSDTTYEALGTIAAANPNGVLVHRDEVSSLMTHLGREENAPARGAYLTGWNGTDSYTFDRIGRGHLHVDPLCLSIVGSIQPGKLATFISHANKGGEGDDGMVQRFNLLTWPDQAATWKDTDEYPNADAFAKANAAFDTVQQLKFDPNNTKYDLAAHRLFVTFDEAASQLFSAWQGGLEHRLRSGELHSSIESHLAKYRKLVPALALINQLFDHGPGFVGIAALQRAISYSEYFETHAVRAYSAGLGSDAATARAILSRIRKHDIADEFTLRDIHQRGWSSLTDRDTVKLGLDLLVDHRWIRASAPEPHPTGGRPTTRYQVNPKALP